MTLERTDRVNWSTLKYLGVSPKHYIHALATPRVDTEALKLGRLTHAMLFEPNEVAKRYVVSPRFNRACNDDTAISKGYDGGKQAGAAFDLQVAALGAEIVERDWFDSAKAMRDSILADPVACSAIDGGHKEHKITWTDAQTGIECRARVDHVNGRLADLKTTRSLVTCERDAARLGYHAQLAWYADGLAAAGIATSAEPCLVFVENVAPWDTLVLTFTDDDLAAGRRVYRRCLDRLAECRRLNSWPGVSNGVARRINLPDWCDPITEEMEVTIDGQTVKL